MVQVDYATFEQFVDEGIAAIPEEFRRQFNNLSFDIQDLPSAEQTQKLNLRTDHSLFGLYEGVPLLMRGGNYSFVLPDRITIFKRPIEYFAQSVEQLREIVINTVWHEVGHHLGMNEEQVRAAERKRGHKY